MTAGLETREVTVPVPAHYFAALTALRLRPFEQEPEAKPEKRALKAQPGWPHIVHLHWPFTLTK